MTQTQTTYRVLAYTEAHEPPRELGTYATRELAGQVALFLFENWDPEDTHRPAFTDFHVNEVPVLAQLPEFHLWAASVDIATAEEIQVNHMGCPSRLPMEPHWELFAEPLKHVRHPMRFVAGSGKTPEEALANAWRHYDKAVALGAKEILAKCTELAKDALAEAERREREDGPDAEGNPPESACMTQPRILDQMAEAYWGPST
jgi:hypothetical protein